MLTRTSEAHNHGCHLPTGSVAHQLRHLPVSTHACAAAPTPQHKSRHHRPMQRRAAPEAAGACHSHGAAEHSGGEGQVGDGHQRQPKQETVPLSHETFRHDDLCTDGHHSAGFHEDGRLLIFFAARHEAGQARQPARSSQEPARLCHWRCG